MPAAYSDPDPNESSRQPAYVLNAWIAEQLDEVRHTHLRHLAQLCGRLQSEALGWDPARLAEGIQSFHAAGRELRFLDLRHGWLARLRGHHRLAYARFAGAADRIADCARQLKQQATEVAVGHKSHTSGARRVLVEFDLEWKALNAELDQGVTWLQDMCTQIGEARVKGQDDPQLDTQAEAAQSYTQHFKRLEAVSSIARDISVRGNGVLERRSALLTQVKAEVEGFEKAWLRKIEPVVDGTRDGKAPIPGIAHAIEAHDALMKRLSAAADACTALQHEEHLLSQQLLALKQELEGTPAR